MNDLMDLSDRLCLPNKTKASNSKEFNILTNEINEIKLKLLIKHIPFKCNSSM